MYMSENFSRNDIFISEIVGWTLPSKNLKPKLQVTLLSAKNRKKYPFRKREGLLLPGWQSLQADVFF